MTEKFTAEMLGSVSQRIFRYDTRAAAESTHQSRADYLRRREDMKQPPSWMRHAASHVADIDEAKAAAGVNQVGALPQQQQRRGDASTTPVPTAESTTRGGAGAGGSAISTTRAGVSPARQVLSRLQPGEKAPPPVRSPPRSLAISSAARSRAPISADDALAPLSPDCAGRDGVEEKVTVWSYHGKKHMPASKVPGHHSVGNGGSNKSVASSSTASASPPSSFGIAARKKPPFEGEQPISVGDILGKNLNITHAQKVQRSRYEALERERLSHMRSDLEANGWSTEVRPGGPDKVLGRRIYAGLPVELTPAAQEVYARMKQERRRSSLSKRGLD